jgi:16S rRNA (cytosine967-C5)-methyltransferase
MSVSPARAAAFDILLRVEQQAAYASELLHSRRMDELSSADLGLTTEIVMGVLRWRSRLDQAIQEFSFTPLPKLDVQVLTALRIGAYQLQFLDRIPGRSAVNESVELVKAARKISAAPLANAVLRKIANAASRLRRSAAPNIRALKETPDAANALSSWYAHPHWLVERWVAQYGTEATQRICAYDQDVPPTALRLRDPAAEAELKDARMELAPGALLSRARLVVSGDVIHTRAFREGRVSVQDEASQLVASLVGRGERLLDCCAAPGGKTSAMADLNPDAIVVATDLHPHRARLLRELVRAPNVRVIAADATSLPLCAEFDRVLTDVPCSGTGTLARNPEIKWRLQPRDLAELQQRQIAILAAALERVAPGGRLVYSSCSLEPEENVDVIEAVLARGGFRLLPCSEELHRLREKGELVSPDIAALTSGPFLRTLPGVNPCDGFFGAVLERISG